MAVWDHDFSLLPDGPVPAGYTVLSDTGGPNDGGLAVVGGRLRNDSSASAFSALLDAETVEGTLDIELAAGANYSGVMIAWQDAQNFAYVQNVPLYNLSQYVRIAAGVLVSDVRWGGAGSGYLTAAGRFGAEIDAAGNTWLFLNGARGPFLETLPAGLRGMPRGAWLHSTAAPGHPHETARLRMTGVVAPSGLWTEEFGADQNPLAAPWITGEAGTWKAAGGTGSVATLGAYEMAFARRPFPATADVAVEVTFAADSSWPAFVVGRIQFDGGGQNGAGVPKLGLRSVDGQTSQVLAAAPGPLGAGAHTVVLARFGGKVGMRIDDGPVLTAEPADILGGTSLGAVPIGEHEVGLWTSYAFDGAFPVDRIVVRPATAGDVSDTEGPSSQAIAIALAGSGGGLAGSAVVVAADTTDVTGVFSGRMGGSYGAGGLEGRAPWPRTADPVTGRTPYRLVVTNMFGERLGELTNARIGRFGWVLGGLGPLRFSLPTDDPDAALVREGETELQVWRGARLLWWGVAVRLHGNSQVTEYEGATLDWYLDRRVIGRVPKQNLLVNGSFEDGLVGWQRRYTVTSTRAPYPPQAAVVTDRVLNGGRAVRLTGGAALGKQYLDQQVAVTVPVSAIKPMLITLSGWAFIESWQAEAWGSWGLYLERYDPRFPHPDPRLAADGWRLPKMKQVAPLDADTPRGVWVRLETSVTVPADGVEYVLDCRVFAPHGTVVWDELGLHLSERLYWPGTDQALIAKGLVDHAQDESIGNGTFNLGTDMPLTGVRRDREYLWDTREFVGPALRDFGQLASGMDVSVDVTAARRTVRTHFPRMGRDRGVVLELGGLLADFGLDGDGSRVSSRVGVLWQGEGADREEAWAVREPAAGAAMLDTVYDATPGSAVSSLRPQAERGMGRYGQPVLVPTVVTVPGILDDLLDLIGLGDTCRLKINRGRVRFDGPVRVTGLEIDPNAEQMHLTVVPDEGF